LTNAHNKHQTRERIEATPPEICMKIARAAGNAGNLGASIV
jgi:hypothetical protein